MRGPSRRRRDVVAFCVKMVSGEAYGVGCAFWAWNVAPKESCDIFFYVFSFSFSFFKEGWASRFLFWQRKGMCRASVTLKSEIREIFFQGGCWLRSS